MFFRHEDGTEESLEVVLERLAPSSLAAHLDRGRPYDGQPHTVYGERGQTEIKGLTFRDLQDCFIRACFEASGLDIKSWPGTVYQLPWETMDIVAVSQSLSTNIEKFMGIYPNVPRLIPMDPTELHWCGDTLEQAIWQSHEGDCDDPILAQRIIERPNT